MSSVHISINIWELAIPMYWILFYGYWSPKIKILPLLLMQQNWEELSSNFGISIRLEEQAQWNCDAFDSTVQLWIHRLPTPHKQPQQRCCCFGRRRGVMDQEGCCSQSRGETGVNTLVLGPVTSPSSSQLCNTTPMSSLLFARLWAGTGGTWPVVVAAQICVAAAREEADWKHLISQVHSQKLK